MDARRKPGMLDSPSRRRARLPRRKREIEHGRDAPAKGCTVAGRRDPASDRRRDPPAPGGCRPDRAAGRAGGGHRPVLPRPDRGSAPRGPATTVLAAIGAVLGADLSVRLFPTTGPRIHDRFQAAMEEALLAGAAPAVDRLAGGAVVTSRRGASSTWCSTTGRRRCSWPASSTARSAASSSRSAGIARRSCRCRRRTCGGSRRRDGEPATSRLLVLRSTRDLRDLARAFESTLAAAYPARAADVVAALDVRCAMARSRDRLDAASTVPTCGCWTVRRAAWGSGDDREPDRRVRFRGSRAPAIGPPIGGRCEPTRTSGVGTRRGGSGPLDPVPCWSPCRPTSRAGSRSHASRDPVAPAAPRRRDPAAPRAGRSRHPGWAVQAQPPEPLAQRHRHHGPPPRQPHAGTMTRRPPPARARSARRGRPRPGARRRPAPGTARRSRATGPTRRIALNTRTLAMPAASAPQ